MPPSWKSTSQQSDQQQENHCTDRGDNDGATQSGADVNTELRQQPCAEQGADNPDRDIADETKTVSRHQLSGEPSGNETNQQDDEQTFP